MVRLLLLLLALLAAACGADGSVQVAVRFVLDPTSCGAGTPQEQVLDRGCGALVALHAIDAVAADGPVLAQACVTLEPSADTDTPLSQLPIALAAAKARLQPAIEEGRTVILELAVYNPAIRDSCPRYVPQTAFHSKSRRRAGPSAPVPVYYGQSAPTTLRGEPRFEIVLACLSEPFLCDADAATIEGAQAQVIDLATLEPPLEDEVGELDVRAGYVVGSGDGTGPWSWSSVARLDPVGSGLFAASGLDLQFPPECVGSLVTRVGTSASVSTGSCEGDVSGGSPREASMQAYYVPREMSEGIRQALGLEDFDEGFVVGRVVDGAGAPLAGAALEGVGAGEIKLDVGYLDESFQILAGNDQTGPTGLFVLAAETAPRCCFRLRATVAAEPSRSGLSGGVVGLVDGILMGTVVRVP